MNITGCDAKALKRVMDKEKLTWRSFADPGELGQGTIAKGWNVSLTPTLYVIDHAGIIRHKWVGGADEKTVEEALDKLMKSGGQSAPAR